MRKASLISPAKLLPSGVLAGNSSKNMQTLVYLYCEKALFEECGRLERPMSQSLPDDEQLRNDAQLRAFINRELQARFAPEDGVLRSSRARAEAENVPAIQISPLQGKLLQVLALACRARKILEIGALAGYSGVWLARGLPRDGKLISLEIDPRHAEIARATFAAAGLSDRAEVHVGPALALMHTLTPQAPFDLIFIDADKRNNPQYLDWALTLSRPGSLIVADNVIRRGRALQTPPPDESAAGAAEYTRKILGHPRLVSVAFPIITEVSSSADDGMDGIAISVVLE